MNFIMMASESLVKMHRFEYSKSLIFVSSFNLLGTRSIRLSYADAFFITLFSFDVFISLLWRIEVSKGNTNTHTHHTHARTQTHKHTLITRI